MIRDGHHGKNNADRVKQQECTVCEYTKQARKLSKSDVIMELKEICIYAGLRGPFKYSTLGGNRYFLTMKMTSHRFCEVRALQTRADMSETCLNYIALVDRSGQQKVKIVRTENAKEFKNTNICLRTI